MDVTEEYKKLLEEFRNECGIVFKYSNYMTHEEMNEFQFWMLSKSKIKFTNVSNRKYELN
jgi:hypothetical protein